MYGKHIEKNANITTAKYGFEESFISGVEKIGSLNVRPTKNIKELISTHYLFENRKKIIGKYMKMDPVQDINLP
jgi:hypothetical protein